MFLTSGAWKLSADLKLQESKGLKGICGLNFFYLAEDEKPFFTQWYANGKGVTILFTSWTVNR